MFAKSRHKRFKHIAIAVLYASFLLAEGGELFVSHGHDFQFSTYESKISLEIPEHLPEKGEKPLVDKIKVNNENERRDHGRNLKRAEYSNCIEIDDEGTLLCVGAGLSLAS